MIHMVGSGVGKTQFLLTLLLAVQLPAPQGLAKSAIYISTEAALSTSRLSQLLSTHPQLRDLPPSQKPSLSNIHAIQVPDLEAQDHILRFQVPVAIKRFNVGLLVIDSIASNYRAEMDVLPSTSSIAPVRTSSVQILGERRAHLVRLGTLLRDLARTHEIAIVCSNQVADRFDSPIPFSNHSATSSMPAHSGMQTQGADPLTLDHQQRWFTGWGDRPSDVMLMGAGKTPALGLVWSNQIAGRVALVKETRDGGEDRGRRRWMRVVFASWMGQTNGRGVEYEILSEGVRAVTKNEEDATTAVE
jgi:DNA repair protein RAD57